MRSRHILLLVALLASIGALVSLYLVWGHYTTGPTFCKIGGAINCDLVNRGPYGKIVGIPVSGIGVLGYLLLGGLALVSFFLEARQKEAIRALKIAATLGFIFSLYLLHLELFVIFAVCPFCMVSLILITIIVTLAWVIPSCDGIGRPSEPNIRNS